MEDTIKARIEKIRSAEGAEDLKKCICPFFERGGNPDCLTCKKTESEVEDCRDYYLERITMHPMDIWSEDFDKVTAIKRDVLPVEEVTGIGIVCNNCYMYDKCPLYKKDYACGIAWTGNDKPKTAMEFVDFLIDAQYERVKRSAVFEKIDGGVPDAGLSGEMDRLSGYVVTKIDMSRERLSINVEATGAATPTGGGILAKIFGGAPAPVALADKRPIEIPDKAESLGEVIDITEVKTEEPEKVPRKRKQS